MIPIQHRIGAHLPLGPGMVRAADRAAAIGANALQIFSDNPTAWRRRTEPPDELPAFRQRLTELAIGPLAIHASYLINLAGPDDELWCRSVALLAHELETATLYGAPVVNVHIGSHRGRGAAFGARRVAEGIAGAFDAAGASVNGTRLVLENSAGGGSGLGASLDELEQVLTAVRDVGVPDDRVGLCLDTAHLWGAGHRIDRPEDVDGLLRMLDRRVGIDRVAMVHLNDSKSEPGSRSDRHQHIGAGQIGPTGMRAILTHPLLAGRPFYLETPGMDEGYDAVNVARARALIDGRALDELPREALEMRGSRSRTPPAENGD